MVTTDNTLELLKRAAKTLTHLECPEDALTIGDFMTLIRAAQREVEQELQSHCNEPAISTRSRPRKGSGQVQEQNAGSCGILAGGNGSPYFICGLPLGHAGEHVGNKQPTPNAAGVVGSNPTAGNVSPESAAFPLKFSNDSLRQKILSDPDDEPSAGNCPIGDHDDNDASKDASGERDEVRRPGNPDQPDVIRSGEKRGLPGRRVGRGQHVQQVHAERQSPDDHSEPGAAGQVQRGPDVLRGLHAGSVEAPPAAPDVASTAGELENSLEVLRLVANDSSHARVEPWHAIVILSRIASLEAKVKELEGTLVYKRMCFATEEAATLHVLLDDMTADRDRLAADLAAAKLEAERGREWREWGLRHGSHIYFRLKGEPTPNNNDAPGCIYCRDALAAMPKEPT